MALGLKYLNQIHKEIEGEKKISIRSLTHKECYHGGLCDTNCGGKKEICGNYEGKR